MVLSVVVVVVVWVRGSGVSAVMLDLIPLLVDTGLSDRCDRGTGVWSGVGIISTTASSKNEKNYIEKL